jgi:hypothetical protein
MGWADLTGYWFLPKKKEKIWLFTHVFGSAKK